jgi:hypothetical protein
MSLTVYSGFPRQQLSYKQKGYKWGKQCVDFADAKGSILNYSALRKSIAHKKINYDLVNMKLHTEDIAYVLNPNKLKAGFIPDTLQHYPTINSYLSLLQGEAISRSFEWHVIVTNPNAVSDIERVKRDAIYESLKALIENQSISDEDYQKRMQEQSDYFEYQYQDMREIRANELLKHYSKEQDFKHLFDIEGIMDALIANEEHYYVGVKGGEPYIEKINPLELRVYRNGVSNKTEDADMIVWETFRSIGWVYDTYYDVLSKKDCAYLEKIATGSIDSDSDEDIWHSNRAFYDPEWGNQIVNNPHFFSEILGEYGYTNSLLPYDSAGNVRVLRVFWKSRRKIKKIKKYDLQTGEEEFHFYPETYIPNKAFGEEEEVFWVNEAWEGTKIGTDIYVNIRPCPIQYNSMSSPSKCHFGIIGQLYNINNNNSPSLVDILKPYAYLYDATIDKLYKLLESNLGKLTIFDTASIPDSWKVEQWLYFAKVNHLAVRNSFNEGKKGAATGKLYGSMNNNTTGVIDASVNQEISFNIELLNWIDTNMGKVCGITPQRLGQVSNRETVGGVERATLQSSHITEAIFARHDNLKKRVLEAFIDTSKIALKGRKKKFEYITSTGALKIMEIDGDEYNENDYGFVTDNSQGTQLLLQRLDSFAQTGLQNQLFNFSTLMKLYSSDSISEKIRMMESAERRTQELQEQQRQQEMQLQQQQLEQQAQITEQQQEMQYRMHQEDNETKILVAQINSQAEYQRYAMIQEETGLTKLEEVKFKNKELEQSAKEFDAKLELDNKKLELEKQKQKDDVRLKEKQITATKKKQ